MNKGMRRTQRNYIIVGLCVILLIMVVGYAAFQSQLKISGTSNIGSNFLVKIIDIQVSNIVGGAADKEDVTTHTDTTATFGTTLQSPGDSITYDITIENQGTIDAVLKTITKTDTSNSAILFTTSGVNEGDPLNVGEIATMQVIVTSYNEKIENTIKLNTKRMVGLQRGLSRCKKGSKNRYKMKLKIQRLYQKIRNARKHMIHDITNKLIKENDIIVTENLDVKSMQKNHYVAKGLNEKPISEIIRVLKYKANWNNKKLIQIDRYYPSSQICSVCDYQNKKVKSLSIRNWECPNCHTKHKRDYNAAVNIMFKGLEKYMKGIEQGI